MTMGVAGSVGRVNLVAAMRCTHTRTSSPLLLCCRDWCKKWEHNPWKGLDSRTGTVTRVRHNVAAVGETVGAEAMEYRRACRIGKTPSN